MRLHSLEVTAFGPFADTVSVDFDSLSSAGVFLLTGPTGAGKSSVLDAVCFGLYGDVPGDRASAKRLRSDHAAAGVAPRVRLECTLSGRRFRITRSPGWERPKKRGPGTTRQQPSVSLSERIDGAWQPVTTRLDEAGHLVAHLLGMNLTQFTQVAMLPQGRFQSFLRARSDDRHRLLQQLFRTGRFEAVEAWLRARRSELASRARDHHQRVAELASRASEAAGRPLPAGWLAGGLDDPGAVGGLHAWAAEHRAGLDDEVGRLTASLLTARSHAVATASAHDEGRALSQTQERHRSALAERAALLARSDEVDALREAVAAAHRAAAVLPLTRARAAAASARDLARRRLSQLADVAREWDLPDAGEDAVTAVVASLTAELAATEALLPTQRRLTRVLEEAATLEERQAATEAELAVVTAVVESAPERLASLVAERDGARLAVDAARVLSADAEGLRARVTAARELVELGGLLESAEERRRAAVDAAQRARDDWLRLQEQRITGMAAELAGTLAVGGCCPVCGSAEHPSPARALPDAPDEAAERDARRLLDDAETHRHAREEAVRDLRTRIALAERAADGCSAVDGETRLVALDHELAQHQHAAARLPDLDLRVDAARTALQADEQRRSELRLTQARDSAALATLAGEAEEMTAHLGAALAGTGAVSLDARRRQLSRGLTRLRDLAVAVRAVEDASTAAALADEQLADAARTAGFAESADALAAVLPPADLTAAESALFAHDAALAGCQEVLADPDVAAAADRPSPDLPDLEQRSARAAADLMDAETATRTAVGRLARFEELASQLTDALAAAAPLHDDLALVTRLSLFVDGRSPDNRLQMRLSAYVLAARLGQVVAAANERLATMSDRRYALEHTGRRGAGETRGGLSLVVRDDWTGETRDPATLSGGETFVVSLALALGLADVVTHETGGASLDTLFVDEGFGALDADTLDDVLDTLDALRDGGRIVGVVSHVPQMRERIPAHLDVRKGRHGSTLALSRS